MAVWIDTSIAALDVEASLPLISGQRRERVLAMKSESRRRESVAAYLLLCRALQEAVPGCCGGGAWPPVFTFGDHGKPSLRDLPGVHFSMSHCRGAVAVAVADRPVGIDIERTDRRVSDALMRYAMNDAELEQITDTPSFVRLWTMKEALLKMTGEGLQGGLRDALAVARRDVSFTHHRRDGYICTVCEKIS